ncbi:tRNA-modifying protein YgfZ [Shewanella sp. 202IG2-18]|uniref:tRNA-modifying protein YgfZ n=1 Tax=Parashewanella hymeniacidonis TaxID=2807618 RepID=UPI0019607E0C|nr:tRNA-modifying protein YgfZ [Parashewanella hymeniacidonis]MBM7073424.1 tRNA-modifying protein YgfZ [Parashewanella hymeniacidonis]
MSVTLHNPTWPLTGEQPELLIAKLSHFGLISVTDEQAATFLQGQVTADVTGLAETDWCWGAHCDPKGKMLASFRLFKAQEAIWMLLPKTTVDADLPQLQKYAVFSKVTLSDATTDKLLFGIAGSGASVFIEKHFGELSGRVSESNSVIILQDNERYVLVVDADAELDFLDGEAVFESSSWQALEVASGYPNIAANHSGAYIPQMCNLDALAGISFTKGCYMGQETVARMKYRGGNKRALYILEGTVNNQLTKDGFVEVALENGHRKAGNIVEYVQRGSEVLMTVVLANDTDETAHFRVAGDSESQLVIKPLPYVLEVSDA